MYILTLPYANATLCQNFKAIGEELSEISGYVQTNIYIFIYIDIKLNLVQASWVEFRKVSCIVRIGSIC